MLFIKSQGMRGNKSYMLRHAHATMISTNGIVSTTATTTTTAMTATTTSEIYTMREKRVYLQLHELDYNHTKCEKQNTG